MRYPIFIGVESKFVNQISEIINEISEKTSKCDLELIEVNTVEGTVMDMHILGSREGYQNLYRKITESDPFQIYSIEIFDEHE